MQIKSGQPTDRQSDQGPSGETVHETRQEPAEEPAEGTAEGTAQGTGRRQYHSPLRVERAAQTRRRIIDAAAVVFAAQGYAGTTMKNIAAQAGVSVERVYAESSKAELLVQAFRLRYVGEVDWDSVLSTPVMEDLLAITDRDEGLTALADFLASAHARSADLWVMIRVVAASDELVARERDAIVAWKRESFVESVHWLMRIGILPPASARDVPSLAATINVISSAETYLELCRDWHFTQSQYKNWLTYALTKPVTAPGV